MLGVVELFRLHNKFMLFIYKGNKIICFIIKLFFTNFYKLDNIIIT